MCMCGGRAYVLIKSGTGPFYIGLLLWEKNHRVKLIPYTVFQWWTHKFAYFIPAKQSKWTKNGQMDYYYYYYVIKIISCLYDHKVLYCT